MKSPYERTMLQSPYTQFSFLLPLLPTLIERHSKFGPLHRSRIDLITPLHPRTPPLQIHRIVPHQPPLLLLPPIIPTRAHLPPTLLVEWHIIRRGGGTEVPEFVGEEVVETDDGERAAGDEVDEVVMR